MLHSPNYLWRVLFARDENSPAFECIKVVFDLLQADLLKQAATQDLVQLNLPKD